ncbi:hypothetical protein [Phenylobacterium sp.]|uniref:hypothetical protein n=1 Tax=Phenylobacterium sp. TaxID=1871053 RepID=UPI00391C2EC2
MSVAADWERTRMAVGERVVIGRVAPVTTWLILLSSIALVALLLWMALVRGYYHPRYEGRQLGVLYFLPVLIPLGGVIGFFGHRIFALLFRRGAALYIDGGVLLNPPRTSKGVPLEDISRITVDPDQIFVGIAASFAIVTRQGQEFSFAALFYRETAEAMAIALKEELKRRGLQVGPIVHEWDTGPTPQSG